MPVIVHAIIPSGTDLNVKKYYEVVFPEWQFHYQGPNEFWEITTNGDPGTNQLFLAMIAGEQAPAQPMNYYAVQGIDAYLKRVVTYGGTIVTPKTRTPGVGWFAGCEDINGQPFGLWEDDPND
jgi:predicted enzyme related to lactoylglutathione lyase